MVDEEGEATSSDMLKDEVESSTVKVRLKGTSNIASVAADEETVKTAEAPESSSTDESESRSQVRVRAKPWKARFLNTSFPVGGLS